MHTAEISVGPRDDLQVQGWREHRSAHISELITVTYTIYQFWLTAR